MVHPAPAASHARGLVAVGDLGRQPDRNDPLDYGTVPLIQRGATPQVDAVYEAIDSGEHAARLTATVMPEPFDADAWERDPAPYLAVAEPGRVFQTAQPGPDVRRLTLAGPSTVMTVQGQPVSLRVLATPGAAVSWNAFDNGVFVESSLPAVTVQADADGIATATYLPTTGVIGDTSILAGSPMTSGQVRLTVITRLADAAGEQ